MSLPARAAIERLESAMRELPQIELETRHHFSQGMYCRELSIPKGVCLVGKAHKQRHFFMLLKGRILLSDGAEAKEVCAPAIFSCEAGTKRAGLALEDVVCVNIHRTDLTDLDAIEAEQIESDDLALFDARNKVLT